MLINCLGYHLKKSNFKFFILKPSEIKISIVNVFGKNEFAFEYYKPKNRFLTNVDYLPVNSCKTLKI